MRKPIKKLKWVRRFLGDQKGTQILEFAIALPVMLILLASVAEFGRFFYQYTTLTNAVRAGARHASKWQRNSSWTIPETRGIVVYGDYGASSGTPIVPGLSPTNVSVVANGNPPNDVDSVTVSITGYNYVPLFDLGALTGIPSLSLNIPMNATATMHQLYNGPTAG
jgi:Flp pilus assembly protein TadG